MSFRKQAAGLLIHHLLVVQDRPPVSMESILAEGLDAL
jgi:hypothetical protein